MEGEQDIAQEVLPCGGCGATEDRQRCIGCMHDFGTPESAWVRKYARAHTSKDK